MIPKCHLFWITGMQLSCSSLFSFMELCYIPALLCELTRSVCNLTVNCFFMFPVERWIICLCSEFSYAHIFVHLCVTNMKSTSVDQVYHLRNDPFLQSSVMILSISCKVDCFSSQSSMTVCVSLKNFFSTITVTLWKIFMLLVFIHSCWFI
jgi:hypothetical protein